MKKGILKAGILAAVFFLGIIVFSAMTNHTNEDLTTDMAEATLPVVSLFEGDMQMNELRGYTSEMNAVYMRDTITPIGDNRILPVTVSTYKTKVDAISYEIRSLDKERLIADSKVSDYNEGKGKITADIKVQNLLEENTEYLFILKLKSGKNTIYYYTRIIEMEESHVDDCAQFAMNFHEMTFDKEKADSLKTYLEPNSTGDNTTLHKVDIHSSLNQVAWADFEGERMTTPVPSVKEINSSYNVILLNYVVSGKGKKGELEYYNVEEYYRLRYTKDRIYLLNYERTMNQIFRAENSSFYENYVQLGIRSQEVEFLSNEKGDIIGFVQEGELWCYNLSGNYLSQVFSFNGYEGISDRENYQEHDIKIISIDETGSMNFVVYGYMNCGEHEGKVGIAVYHYDSVANTIEEELFIPTTESYQVMKADLGQLMYENMQGSFFIMLEGSVYRIDLSSMKVEEYITGLKEGSYAISDSHRYFAWMEGDNTFAAEKLYLADLDTGKEHEITAGSGEYLRPLGFIEEDFVYGKARESEVVMDLAGNTTFPMYQVLILDSENMQQLKQYEKEGYYVSGVEISDYIMYLDRIQYNGMAYVDADREIIRNREGENVKTVAIHTTVTEKRQTQVQIALPDVVKESSPKLLTPKQVVMDKNREITLNSNGHENCYYAYAKGDVLLLTDDVKEAISVANAQMGVVIGDEQQYIWKRAKSSIKTPMEVTIGAEEAEANSIAQCISAILEHESININVSALIEQGKTPKEILETTMQDTSVLDLKGCNLDEVLYYVNLGNPVFAMKSNESAVLIVGYDAQNVEVFDPATLSTEKIGMADAGEMFTNVGNVFLGYQK